MKKGCCSQSLHEKGMKVKKRPAELLTESPFMVLNTGKKEHEEDLVGRSLVATQLLVHSI